MAFLCTLMDDPVVASDGHTYNREEIQNWFKHHETSPHTNEPFEHKNLIPNIARRRQIIAWREKHGLPVPSFAAPAKAQASRGGGGAAERQQKIREVEQKVRFAISLSRSSFSSFPPPFATTSICVALLLRAWQAAAAIRIADRFAHTFAHDAAQRGDIALLQDVLIIDQSCLEKRSVL